MARTAVTLTTLTAATAVADAAGTALDPTNGHSISCSSVPIERVVLRIVNTLDGEMAVTILAGDSPPALSAGVGNVTVALAAATITEYWDAETAGSPVNITTPTVSWVSALSSGRFVQSDGTLHVDVAASMTGTITAFYIPRT